MLIFTALVSACGARTALDDAADAAVASPCTWRLGPSVEVDRRSDTVWVAAAAVRSDADVALVLVSGVATEVSLLEPRVIGSTATGPLEGLSGAGGGWNALAFESDRQVLRRLDGEEREVVGTGAARLGSTPVSSDVALEATDGLHVLSWVEGGGSSTSERADDPMTMANPKAVRVGSGQWVVAGRHLGAFGVAFLGAGPTDFLELSASTVDIEVEWGGEGRLLVMWERTGHERGISTVDLHTLRVEPLALPVPVVDEPDPDHMFAAERDLLLFPGLDGDHEHPFIVIVADDGTTLLDIIEADRFADTWLFGRPGTNVAAVAWTTDDRHAIRLAPLRCE
jgi:hypothetical protein